MNQSIILTPDIHSINEPRYISLVESEFGTEDIYQEVPPEYNNEKTIKPFFLEKKMKTNKTLRMSPLTQLYVGSLTIIGLFIVFKLSLAKR
jgi:hypothetical protein